MMRLSVYLMDAMLSSILSIIVVIAILVPSDERSGERYSIAAFIALNLSLVVCSASVFMLSGLFFSKKDMEKSKNRGRMCVFILEMIGVTYFGLIILIILMGLTSDMSYYSWMAYELIRRHEAGSSISLEPVKNLVYILSLLICMLVSSILAWLVRRAATWWMVIYKPPDH